MIRSRFPVIGLILSAVVSLTAGQSASAQSTFVALGWGTWDKEAGTSICAIFNENPDRYDMRCALEAPPILEPGATGNIRALHREELDFGQTTSYWKYQAFKGTTRFKEAGPYPELRTVLTFGFVELAIVAQEGLGARTLDDLRNISARTTNLAIAESMVEDLARALDWDLKTPSGGRHGQKDRIGKLCDQSSDVELLVDFAGFLDRKLPEIFKRCSLKRIAIDEASLDKIVSEIPYFRKGNSPGSFGLFNALVSSETVPDDVVYNFTRALWENREKVKGHSVFFLEDDFTKSASINLVPPLHSGADRFFEESGLKN